MKNHPYLKASGISLLFHTVLVSLLLLFGDKLAAPPSLAAPIVIDFSPAVVVDTGASPVEPSPLPPRAERPMERLSTPVTAVPSRESLPLENMQQTDTSAAAMLQTISAETVPTAAELPSTATGSGGKPREPQGHSTDSKPVVKTEAGYISGSRPPYPRDAQQAGWEGTVVIRVLVGTNGSAAAVAVHSSSGFRSLDESAAQAVKQWRFSPARQGATAVESYYDVRVRFKIEDWK